MRSLGTNNSERAPDGLQLERGSAQGVGVGPGKPDSRSARIDVNQNPDGVQQAHRTQEICETRRISRDFDTARRIRTPIPDVSEECIGGADLFE
jgi:hypothetical protein